MGHLILIRHGESEWNKKNIFTGWIDIPLSLKGVEEALAGGREVRDLPIDIIFTSTLCRGIMTAMLVMNVHASGKVPYIQHVDEPEFAKWRQCYSEETRAEMIPVITSWHLNERMYGELQGMDKQKMREKYGEAQIKVWRRSYDVAPPHGESLKMTKERTLPYFQSEIFPLLHADKNVLISAHGNSLRSIIMELDSLSESEVVSLEIPTGKPLVYTLQNGKLVKNAPPT